MSLRRFKEHVQNNNPKHFLSEEEFVQLRVELAKANVAAAANGEGEEETPAEELPPGTEDLPDPAKVRLHLLTLEEGLICHNMPES